MIQIGKLPRVDRKKLAIVHTDDMLNNYSDEIECSINYSKIYTRDGLFLSDNTPVSETIARPRGVLPDYMCPPFDTKISVTRNDTVTELFSMPEDVRVAVLNFASYKNPGGMYYEGSSAQEEFLCHHSTLYPVLENFRAAYYSSHKSTLNRALYTDTALYSMCITFFDYQLIYGDDRFSCKVNGTREADVITCAAPNRGTFERYQCSHPLTEEIKKLLYDTMYRRCELVLEIAKVNGVRYLVLGAFGCGVFGNKPEEVAGIFHKLLTTTYLGEFKEVRFAIPIGKDGNNLAFRKVFSKYLQY